MDAGPMLRNNAAALRDSGLEAVLIGNAAAALHGAPVTTTDFDFDRDIGGDLSLVIAHGLSSAGTHFGAALARAGVFGA